MSRGMKINDGKSIKVPLNTFPCRGRGQVLAFFSLLFSPSSPFTPLSFFFSLQLSLWPAASCLGSILGCSAFLSFIRDPLPSHPGIFYFAFSARSSSSISLAFTLASSNTRGTHTFAPFVTRRHTPSPLSSLPSSRFSRGNFPLLRESLRRFWWRNYSRGRVLEW